MDIPKFMKMIVIMTYQSNLMICLEILPWLASTDMLRWNMLLLRNPKRRMLWLTPVGKQLGISGTEGTTNGLLVALDFLGQIQSFAQVQVKGYLVSRNKNMPNLRLLKSGVSIRSKSQVALFS
jgi:hypothetical protein